MGNLTTGGYDVNFSLTPPFPVDKLATIVASELASSDEERQHVHHLMARGLPPIVKTEVLAFILGISHKLLYAMTLRPENYYRFFTIPKRRGGERQIATPRVFLKVVQKWLLMNILYRKTLPPYVTGFVPGRGLLPNARYHIGSKYLARIDLKDFFPSVGYEKVRSLYSDFGFPEKVVDLLTRLCLLGRVLPQGAPTSPHLANLAFMPCDLEIEGIAKSHGISYSRYADDLTFSSGKQIGHDFVRQIENVVAKNGFEINREKISVSGPGQRLFTTGMVVHTKPQPLRKIRRQLRARFHQARLHPERFKEEREANKLIGWAAYVNMYDPKLGGNYLAIARTVLELTRGNV